MGIKQYFGVILCIATNSVVQVYSGQFENEMCLAQALEIHVVLKNEVCPDRLLQPKEDIRNCLILCKGRYNVYNISQEKQYCINYMISGILSKTLEARLCNISKCITEDIFFDCFTHESDKINTQNQTLEKENGCIGLGTVISLTLSSVIVGSLIGICICCLITRFRNLKKRYDTQMPSSVFYQPSHSEEHGLSEGRIIISPLEETEYADIEDQFRMVAKAIQVPSYKEDSSSSSRSRENIYHHLSGLDDRTKSALLSSDSLSEDYINESKMIEVRNGSPSLKSVIIHAGSPSSKSNGDSKVSPTGSEGNGKYYALEKEYLIFKSDNGCT